jgi:hypothetical protein
MQINAVGFGLRPFPITDDEPIRGSRLQPGGSHFRAMFDEPLYSYKIPNSEFVALSWRSKENVLKRNIYRSAGAVAMGHWPGVAAVGEVAKAASGISRGLWFALQPVSILEQILLGILVCDPFLLLQRTNEEFTHKAQYR